MGCGSSSALSAPDAPAWEIHQKQLKTSEQSILAHISQQQHRNHIKVGVFGLRSSGKSAFLHTIRRHLTQPDATPFVPLPPSNDSFELFTGPLNGYHITCIDSPGFPFSSSNTRASVRAMLPHLNRIIWVVDSQASWNWDLDTTELMELWREVILASLASSQTYASPRHPPSSPSPGVGGESETRPRRKSTLNGNNGHVIPTLHIVCAKQVEQATTTTTAGTTAAPHASEHSTNLTPPPVFSSSLSAPAPTLAPHEIAAYMQLSSLLPSATVHGFNCLYDASRLDPLLSHLLGPLALHPTSSSVLSAPPPDHSRPSHGIASSYGGGGGPLSQNLKRQSRRRTWDRDSRSNLTQTNPTNATSATPNMNANSVTSDGMTRLRLSDGTYASPKLAQTLVSLHEGSIHVPPPLILPQASVSSNIHHAESVQFTFPTTTNRTQAAHAHTHSRDDTLPLMSPSHVQLVYPFQAVSTDGASSIGIGSPLQQPRNREMKRQMSVIIKSQQAAITTM